MYLLYHIKSLHDVMKLRVLKMYFPLLSLIMADKKKEDTEN